MNPETQKNEPISEEMLEKIREAYKNLERFQLSPQHIAAKAKFLEIVLKKP